MVCTEGEALGTVIAVVTFGSDLKTFPQCLPFIPIGLSDADRYHHAGAG